MEETTATGEYFMMRSENLAFKNVNFKGKYSFQYIKMQLLKTVYWIQRMLSGMAKT